MKTRNPNATCGNCPYWHRHPKSTCGNCQAVSWTFIEKLDTEWCGQHPDFWLEEEAPRHDPGVLAMQALVETDGRKENEVRAILDGRKCQTRRLTQIAGAGDNLYIDAPLPPQFARVILKITGVHQEPLRTISYEDVVAEGFEGRFEFADYWNSIYGNRPGCAWSDNPVVWVHEFEIVEIAGKETET